MKPFLKYFGGKHRLAPHYGPPRRKVVVEPFAGGAGYSCYWEPDKVILVEKYERLANVWKWLINEATYSDIMDLDPHLEDVRDSDYPQPVKDFIGWNLARGDEMPRNRITEHMRTWCRTPAGTLKSSVWGPRKQANLAKQVHRIKNWEIICGDYSDAPAIDAHFHVDPPYQHQGTRYACGSKQLDFAALARWCRERECVDVCEAAPADWMPFEPLVTAKSQMRDEYAELIWRRIGVENSLLRRAK